MKRKIEGKKRAYMLVEVPPNIWLEIHSSLMVSNSIPAQRVRAKRKAEERIKKWSKDDGKRQRGDQSTEPGVR